MKKLFFNSLMITLLFGISNQILANSEITLGTPAIGGNGCPKESAQVYLNSEGELFLRFNQYRTEAGLSNSKIARKSCNLAIPIHLPSGLALSIVSSEYRGSVLLPRKATAEFNSEYFFVGQTGLKNKHLIKGKSSGEFRLIDDIAIESRVLSKCGEDTILRVNTSLLVTTNRRNDQALAQIDSMNVDSGVVFRLETRNCQM